MGCCLAWKGGLGEMRSGEDGGVSIWGCYSEAVVRFKVDLRVKKSLALILTLAGEGENSRFRERRHH
jgi:hypothetical protein